jgi:hypothetical protein
VSSGTSSPPSTSFAERQLPLRRRDRFKRLDTDQAMGYETLEFEAGRVMAEEIAGPLGITGTGRSS